MRRSEIPADRVRIGKNCIIAAGALVPPGREIPEGSVVMGAPGTVVRQVSEKDLALIAHATESYRVRAQEYRANLRVDPRYVTIRSPLTADNA